ncbi:MAG: NeuD/PglB/VioB family sugar acetyltransferase [Kiritimatiellaeota bacterium]|nr:NeuD/PglB/VioB family sugar acetyltransferase [Kiritimatiellota bacterium]
MMRIVIIGASGFGKEVAWVIGRINRVAPTFEIVGFCDDAVDKQEGAFAGRPLLGAVANVSPSEGLGFICAIGNNRNRQRATAQAIGMGLVPVTVIDPTAVIAPDAVIGKGTFIGIGSVVSVGARLGDGVIVNHQACVGHDAVLGDFAQVCPGARISGGCNIGEGALLGTNAATLPLKKMGAWSTLGIGTAALRDIPDGATLIRIKN